MALHTHLILPDLTNSKNLISRTPVSPAELLSLIIILGFFKDIHTFLFVSTFFFLRNIIMALKHLFIMLGGKRCLLRQKENHPFTYLEEVHVS